MEDFSYTPETDDLYTLRATASDLAGNQSETSVTFSVNRFGSVYTLDEWTDEMKFEIQKLDAKLLELSSEKSEQEKRDDCLDKEILETLDFIQSNANKIEITAKRCSSPNH